MRVGVMVAIMMGLGSAAGSACAQADASILGAVDPVGTRTSEDAGFILLEHGLWTHTVLAEPPTVADIPGKPARRRVPHRTSFARGALLPLVYLAENRHGLPSGLLDALIWTESRYNALATSRVGAAGLAQLMPATATDIGVVNRYDPRQSIDGGARYLRQMIDRFGSVHLALAAYNAGPGAVGRKGGIPLNGETPQYVARVMKRWLGNPQ